MQNQLYQQRLMQQQLQQQQQQQMEAAILRQRLEEATKAQQGTVPEVIELD